MADRSGKGKAAAAQGKKRPSANAGGKKTGDNDREDPLQAVILADSFETRFNPFTLEKPRCLLPLANTPLIEYTLEFLAMAGVLEVFIYCGRHATEVEEYLHASKWHPLTSPASPFSTLQMIKATSRSVGDAMRDLDARALITGDFLLVHGDLVSNLPIDAALAAHKARRVADKNAIMTMILRSAGSEDHRMKAQGVSPLFVMNPAKKRCLYYEEMSVLSSHKYFNLDPDLLSEHAEMEIRTDLIDCGIDICTPDVLALWSESFDYDMPRRHYLHGVLKDYELNGKTIHAEIVSDYYASRVKNLQAYDAVSKDILGRWTYPLVPDSNLMGDHAYKFERGGLCKEDGVVMARSSTVGKKTVIGKDSHIGEGSSISNTILGRRCRIGKNVSIRDAYIWDDVVIGDDTQVHQAIIANAAVIGKHCKVSPGSLISFGVRLADGTVTKGGSRITRAKKEDDGFGEESSDVSDEPEVVGAGGEGHEFEDSDEEDEDLQLQSSLIYSTERFTISSESISTISSDVSDSSVGHERSRLDSFAESVSDDDRSVAGGEAFHQDAVADVVRTLAQAGDFHNLRVEFTSLRLSNNASDHQMRKAIATAFVKRISQLVDSGIPASKAVSETLEYKGAASFINEVAIGTKKLVEDQVDFLLCTQKDLTHRNSGEALLIPFLKQMYDDDILDEEAFEEWYEDEKAQEGEDMLRVRAKAAVFMTALRNAESDSDEDEDDDDDDDEEDDE